MAESDRKLETEAPPPTRDNRLLVNLTQISGDLKKNLRRSGKKKLDWTGLDWTGLDWTRLESIGLDWTRLELTGLDWTRLDSTRLNWTRLDSNWIRLDSSGGGGGAAAAAVTKISGVDEARLLRDRWSLLLAVQPQLSKKNEHSIACSSFPFSLLFLRSCVLTSRIRASLSRTLFRSRAPLTFTVIGVNVGRRTRCIPICFCSHGYTPVPILLP